MCVHSKCKNLYQVSYSSEVKKEKKKRKEKRKQTFFGQTLEGHLGRLCVFDIAYKSYNSI